MQAMRQMGGGLIYGLISAVLVIGGISLALAETRPFTRPTGTPGLTQVPQTAPPTPPGSPVPSSPTSTRALVPTPACVPPAGWIAIAVQPGDTLASLANANHTTPAQLMQANCLLTGGLAPGYAIYVPSYNLPTSTFVSCGPPYGWVQGYVVQPGDTLYHIATLYGTTVSDLQRANCLFTTTIGIGLRLWVPNVLPLNPILTLLPDFSTSTNVPTEPLTLTPYPFTATVIPTDTSPPPTYPPATPTVTSFPVTP